MFNPFELNEETIISPLSDIDPDLHYFNTLQNGASPICDYHLEDSFHEKKTQLSITNDSFSLMQTYLRSMPNNVQKFKTYLELLEPKFKVIGITETWFHEGNHLLYGFEGYNAISNYRKSQRGEEFQYLFGTA